MTGISTAEHSKTSNWKKCWPPAFLESTDYRHIKIKNLTIQNIFLFISCRSLNPLTDLSYQMQKKNALHPIQFIGEHSL